MRGSNRVWFATSNDHKFEEAKLVLKEFGISPGRIREKGVEVQSDDVGLIASRAASEMYSLRRVPLFTEDTSLSVATLGGFPGPYASFAYRTLGVDGLTKLAGKSGKVPAEFTSAVAFCDGGRVRVFRGSLRGSLASEARGGRGFGFDPIFIPEGSARTLAEMSMAEKCEISHRARALRALARSLAAGRSG